MSNTALLKIYNTVIFPHFNYCCTVWSGAKNRECITKLFRLQKRAGRIILNVKQTHVSTDDILRTLKWMPIHDYFTYRKLMLTFKVMNNLTPEYLNVFTYVRQISSRSTRQSVNGTLYIPKVRTEYYKRSFSVSSAILWNRLPETVRNCRSLVSFKSEYIHHYFNM